MDNLTEKQQVILALVDLEGRREQELEWELSELKELVKTAGGQVVATTWQRRAKPDIALLVGKGKAEEIAQLVDAHEASLVIFNKQLSPAQLRNLEEIIPAQILDRNQLILDIFAQRAASNEGKLQVELAQLQYTLPRLTGRGVEMSRLGGGIGTRGPGETKLETDRRRIRQRIDQLRYDLREVEQRREHQRKNRQKQGLPLVSLVGYTNAGKTSLLSTLTQTSQEGEDKLFATLDTTIRQLELPSGQKALLSDTVGFIQQLPPQLINAFKATLEEIRESDLVLHVVDCSHPQMEEQVETVNSILKEIEADKVSQIMVLNKIDLLEGKDKGQLHSEEVSTSSAVIEKELLLKAQDSSLEEIIPVSAVNGTGLEKLLELIGHKLNLGTKLIDIIIPYDQGQLFSYLKEKAVIKKVEYLNEGIQVELLADQEVQGRLASLNVKSQ
ncbi:MAG: GTPase HflX [Bacillota bacterium]|nr:GTPase HflX [Bacillota bacterium]